jgi:bifunctional UDP-N-acetylglucosamine pyrophosphorylase/glucosamine-1-phosphate N-acetyltransferase
MSSFAAIVLAAGKSTRMRSSKPKALHNIAGWPMLVHILNTLETAGASRIVVVVGHGADQVRSTIGDRVEYVEQVEQRGTGHAAMMAKSLLEDWTDPILVVPGDAPLLSAEAVQAVLKAHADNAATLLSVEMDNPTGYGRIVRNLDGRVVEIVEEKDATPEQRAIREVCVSVYAFNPAFLFDCLSDITPDNAQGEYYLTDVVSVARKRELPVDALLWHDPRVGYGANTRVELAEIDAIFQRRIQHNHMLAGVTIVDPLNTRIEAGVNIGMDTVVWPGTIIRGVTDIGENCTIGPGARIEDARIGEGCRVRDSWIVASEIGSQTTVGPYANIRPNSTIGNNVKIGDFVEVKASTIDDEVSAGHFAYLGDATIGSDTNIGAGTITCNYDGFRKHKTVIGKNVFVGSNSTLVAPVTIGDGAFIAAGSAISEDVAPDSLAIGRSRQTAKDGWAAKWRASNKPSH